MLIIVPWQPVQPHRASWSKDALSLHSQEAVVEGRAGWSSSNIESGNAIVARKRGHAKTTKICFAFNISVLFSRSEVAIAFHLVASQKLNFTLVA
uniref:Uncharacterized protein n=1 Tax=Rhizophora mucronata TaxID=61149 RepID=A0A2P2QDL9_RHIMU